jgi:hypothetical protein
MKPIEDKRMDELEDVAMESAKQLRAFFTYQGNDSRYFQKARLACGMIGAYARLRASETNRMQVEVIVGKALGAVPLKLASGKKG